MDRPLHSYLGSDHEIGLLLEQSAGSRTLRQVSLSTT